VIKLRLATFLFALLALPLAAWSQDASSSLDKRLASLIAPQDGAKRCWRLEGGGASLDTYNIDTENYQVARGVASMALALKVFRWPDAPAGFMCKFALATRFSDRQQDYISIGQCGDAYSETAPEQDEWIRCTIECDGGAMELRSVAPGLEIRWKRDQHLSMSDCEQDDASAESYRQKDTDKILPLTESTFDECAALDLKVFGK
jgi:hypothetical protein